MTISNRQTAKLQDMEWSRRLAEVFPGAVVNKALGLRHEISQLPRFVSEWLVGKFCETGDTRENLAEMDDYVRAHYVERKQKNVALHRLEQQGQIELIDAYKVRVDLSKPEEERYKLEIPSLGLYDAKIQRHIIDSHPRMLVDGVWGMGQLLYKGETGEVILTSITAQCRPGRRVAATFFFDVRHRLHDSVSDSTESAAARLRHQKPVWARCSPAGAEPGRLSGRAPVRAV